MDDNPYQAPGSTCEASAADRTAFQLWLRDRLALVGTALGVFILIELIALLIAFAEGAP